MNDDLSMRLQDFNESGLYRLNCPQTMLEANVALSGLTLFEANISAEQGKGGFLAALAQALKAPSWFGHNWDALADVLNDLSWQPAAGYVLLLNCPATQFGLSDADYDVAIDILNETVSHWKSQNKPFWIFISNDV